MHLRLYFRILACSPVLQNISVTNVLCYGNSNGFIRVQTNGGTGVLNYALSNGDVNSSGTFDSLMERLIR